MPASSAPESALAALRAATRDAHDRLDAALGQHDLGDRDAYARFLDQHARAFLPAEAALIAAAPANGWRFAPRGPALRADIARLGYALPPAMGAPDLRDEAAWWGAAYVLEGSRLGAAMLRQRVGPDLPQRFLGEVKGAWRPFLVALEQKLYDRSSHTAAVGAALAIFSMFEGRGVAPGTDRSELDACAREPLHLVGSIQPGGFLIAVDDRFAIRRVSRDIARFLGPSATPDAMLGRPLDQFLDATLIHDIRNRLSTLTLPDLLVRMAEVRLLPDAPLVSLVMHRSADEVLIEGEPDPSPSHDAGGVVRAMMARLEQTVGIQPLLHEGARQVRALTGFDRVMVYRFAEDDSGEVVAEAVRPGIGSFMGLNYPAGDIPAQARALYRRNLLRLIGDVNDVSVPIVSVPGLAECDLSLAQRRSVSPVHIDYLRNMGVAASMSVSIIVGGRLWGLIACHHLTPHRPGLDRRAIVELFVQMFSLRLESRLNAEMAERAVDTRALTEELLIALTRDVSLADPATIHAAVARAIPCDGIALALRGSVRTAGDVPPPSALDSILAALRHSVDRPIMTANPIAELVPLYVPPTHQAVAMMVLSIGSRGGDVLILFRNEHRRSISWAGNPDKPAMPGDSHRIGPRKSFATFIQKIDGLGMPFTRSELTTAETLRSALVELSLRLTDEAFTERQQANEQQELLIAELNHRVRNILSLIRGLIRQSKPAEGTSIKDFVAQVDRRIHALARAHNQITCDQWGPAPLKSLIDAEAAAYLTSQRDRVHMDGEDVLLNPQAYSAAALVIHELVTNSAKYGSLSDSGTVSIEWDRDAEGNLHLRWREVGGPRVVPPNRRGFGTTIIANSIPYDLGGSADVRYAATGLEADFMIPARHVTLAAPGREAALAAQLSLPDHGEPAKALLEGLTLLLVEDSLIIALDAEDLLKRHGAADVVVESNVEHALLAIERKPPDLALLDVNLGDTTSEPVALALRARGIPFLFATGYGEQLRRAAVLADHPVIQKPYTASSLARALEPLVVELRHAPATLGGTAGQA